MDYLLHFSLLLTVIPWITATYDIACQFGVNLFKRFRDIYGFDTLDSRSFRWAIPKFHISAHREFCRSQFSLHYLPLLGRYDGEGIERNWAKNNKMAPSTKEMGPGSRSDGLDDSFGHQNWSKTIKFGEHRYVSWRMAGGVLIRRSQLLLCSPRSSRPYLSGTRMSSPSTSTMPLCPLKIPTSGRSW